MAVTGLIGVGVRHPSTWSATCWSFRGRRDRWRTPPAARRRSGALWAARVVLLVAVILHVLARGSSPGSTARPARSATRGGTRRSRRSRPAPCGGAVCCCSSSSCFTCSTSRPARSTRRSSAGDVYRNLVTGFRVWWVAAVLPGRDDGRSACTSTTASGARPGRSGVPASPRPLRRPVAALLAIAVCGPASPSFRWPCSSAS